MYCWCIHRPTQRTASCFFLEPLSMATAKPVLSSLLTILALSTPLFLLLHCSHAHPLKTCMFDSIYQLGDSFSDTGNLIRENPAFPFSRLPYGETFFKNATGRCSNGLLMIDYIGEDQTNYLSIFIMFSFFYLVLVSFQKEQRNY